MNKIAFTSVTNNYLPKARVLAHSIKRHASDVTFVLVLADCFEAQLLRANDPFDRVITLQDLDIPDLHRWLFAHDLVEVCTAIKGHAMVRLLEASKDTAVFYFDPDIVITNPLDTLFAELDEASILLTPHGTEPETDLRAIIDNEISHLRYGIYNLGFIAVRSTQAGRAFAHWWARRLHEFCFDDIDNGIFTDQRWVDLAPAFFEGTKVLRDPSYNVATWNLSHRLVEGSLQNGLRVNGRPLVFYHFSGFDSGAMETMLAAYGNRSPVLQDFRDWYVNECDAMGQAELGGHPWFYGTFDNGVQITKGQRRLYRDRSDLQIAFANPFSTQQAEASYFNWHRRHASSNGRDVASRQGDYEIVVIVPDDLSNAEASLQTLLQRTAETSSITIAGTSDLATTVATIAPRVQFMQLTPDLASGVGREAWMLARIKECSSPGIILVQLGVDLPDLWDLRLSVGAKRQTSVATASPLYDGTSNTALFTADARCDAANEDIDRILFNLDHRELVELQDFLHECFYVNTALAQGLLGVDSPANVGTDAATNLRSFARACSLAGYSHALIPDIYVGVDRNGAYRSHTSRWLSPRLDASAQRTSLEHIRASYRDMAATDAQQLPTVAQRASRRHLHISHAWGGGLAHWIRSFCSSDTAHVNMVLRPVGVPGAYGRALELYADIDASSPVRRWELPMPIKATAPSSLAYRRIIDEIVTAYGIDVVFVSTLIGHSMDVLKTKATTVFICHDFFPLTPDIYIRSHNLSGNRVVSFSIDDIYDRGMLRFFPNVTRAEAKAASSAFRDILAARQLRLVAPSESTRQIYLDLAPELHQGDISVIPHGTDVRLLSAAVAPYCEEGRLRIVVPGRVAPEKGSALLARVLPALGSFADLLLIGAGLDGLSLADITNVQVIPTYDREDLATIISDFRPHVGMLLSDFPETFSYTLDELLTLRIPPVAVRIGAFADRIRDGHTGFLVGNDAHSVVELLRWLDRERRRLVAVRVALEDSPKRTESDMVTDYEDLLDCPRFSPRAMDSPTQLPHEGYRYVWPLLSSPRDEQPAEQSGSALDGPANATSADAPWHGISRSNRNQALRPRKRRLEPQRYKQLIERIRQVAAAHLPADATVAVVSKGDEQLLRLKTHRTCHFPQLPTGDYAGHHPANSAEAISHIESLRSRGVEFVLFPNTTFWWFDYYREFKAFLDSTYRQLPLDDDACVIYSLSSVADGATEREITGGLARSLSAGGA